MKCEAIEIMISGYLDNELMQQDRQLVSVHIETCESCRKIYHETKLLKAKMGQLSYPKSDQDMLNELEQDLFVKTSSGIGWFILILGAFFICGMAVIEFVSAENTPWHEKLLIALLLLGPVALFATVVRQRVITYKNDKYKKVKL